MEITPTRVNFEFNPHVPIIMDSGIFKAIKSGGSSREQAIKSMYEDNKFRTQLSKYIAQNQGNEEDTKDIFQEALIILDKNLRNGKIDEDQNINAYLFKTCKLLWLNSLRKNNKIQLIDFEENPEELVTNEDLETYREEGKYKSLQKALTKLNDRCREILVLWSQSYSMKEIMKKSDLKSEAMARKLKHQCLLKLMQIIKSDPNGWED